MIREDMKSVIADTFTGMLETEDLDKITVTKLIGECQISRQTFYYHFKDIMDVLEWTFRQATEELAKKSLAATGRAEALGAYVGFIKKNKRKLEKLLYSRRWVQIENMLAESAVTYLKKIVRGRSPMLEISYDDLEVMLRFYAFGMVGVLLEYVDKPNYNEEKLIRQMERIITGEMFPGDLDRQTAEYS